MIYKIKCIPDGLDLRTKRANVAKIVNLDRQQQLLKDGVLNILQRVASYHMQNHDLNAYLPEMNDENSYNQS